MDDLNEQPRQGRKYQIVTLNDRHREICRRVLLGQKSVDIARDMGVSREVVSYVRNSDAGKDFMGQLTLARNVSAADIARQLEDLAPEAVGVLREGVTGELGGCAQDHLKLKSAMEILDRTGFAKVAKLDARIAHGHFTPDDIAELKRQVEMENSQE